MENVGQSARIARHFHPHLIDRHEKITIHPRRTRLRPAPRTSRNFPKSAPQPGREVTLTGISGTASRTQFVPGDGTEIQFQWSTGDRIWAGGVQSAEAGTDGNVADFGFTKPPGGCTLPDLLQHDRHRRRSRRSDRTTPGGARANCNSDRTAISAMPRPTPKDDSPSRTPPLTSGSTPGRRT